MKAYIEFDGVVDAVDSYYLSQLAELIEKDTGLSVQRNEAETQKGVKADLVTGLAIASLALSSVGTLITVLTFFESQRPKYSISVTHEDAEVSIENIKRDEVQSLVSKLNLEKSSSDIRILVSRDK